MQPTESLELNPSKDKETSICLRIRTSHRSRQKLSLHFEDKCLWERDCDPERWAPLKRNYLSSLIRGLDKPADEINARAFTSQSRAEVPVLLAHSMLYLYKTRWFQHLWDMNQLFWWMGREGSPQDRYPYLACVLSMDDSKSNARRIFTYDKESSDPLYRHALVLEFGLRILEIESGRRFPPNLEEDMDPETDEEATLPFLTLQRALQTLKDKGEVEDDYYNISKACLDFDKSLKKKRLQDVEAGLREWVALHNLIFSPLLQLLARKFKGAAADLLELEITARNAKPKVATAYSKSHPVKVKPNQRGRTQLVTMLEGRHAPTVKSPLSVVLTTPTRDSISSDTKKSQSIDAHQKIGVEYATSSSSTISRGVRLFDDHSDTSDESVRYVVFIDLTTPYIYSQINNFARRSYAVEFLLNLRRFREQYIKPFKKSQRMRIAILDTGVDEADHYLRVKRKSLIKRRMEAGYGHADDPMKAIKTFLGQSAKDNNGHGTQIAGILTQVAPEADLYIAKISDQMYVEVIHHIPHVSPVPTLTIR